MKNFLFSVCCLILILNFGCSKKEEKKTILKQKNLETQMIEVYNDAMKNLRKGMLFMLKKIRSRIIISTINLAPRAVLMSAYGYFSQGYYNDAINNLEDS